ncbi:hypothetical protein CSB20_00125 [bacterium DOLZORAL124_64_63]|nr:MAG: hypothetical protein CSB20_00125 [bacterium DOLZORAL124_64_63]
MFNEIHLSEAYLQFMVDAEILSEADALEVMDAQRKGTPAIGRLALQSGILDMKQVFRVLAAQVDMNTRFGETAINLGYMTESDLIRLLDEQKQRRPKVHQVILEMGLISPEALATVRENFLNDLTRMLA